MLVSSPFTFGFIVVALSYQQYALAGNLERARLDRNHIINPDPDPKVPSIVAGEFHPDRFEGDIIVSEKIKKVKRNAVTGDHRLWEGGIVPYQIDAYTHEDIKEKIHDAIADFHEYTCLKFVPHTNQEDYIWFNSYDDGCFTYLGKEGGMQTLNIAPYTCDAKGNVIHEMMHAIGFGHEQARNDRDQYIKINWDNISRGAKHNFQRLGDLENNQGLPYDYFSVLHYPSTAYAPWGHKKPSIETLDKSLQRKIGQRLGFSRGDVIEINKLYKCGDVAGIQDDGDCVDHYMAKTCQQNFERYGKSSSCGEDSYFSVVKMCRKSCGKC